MADTHHEGAHHGPDLKTYLVIGGVLAVFTAFSFGVAALMERGTVPPIALIVITAIVKALLVATYFMHLKYDWGKVFFMMIPAVILASMMIIVLLPDIVFAWH
jgi:caa(3)-type oxidase subunit IV